MAPRLLMIAASIGLALAILALSLLPGGERLPTTGWDKANHALAFLLLAALAMLAFPVRKYRMALIVLAWGALIELLQGLTTYRSAEWADLGADAIGIGCGWIVVSLLSRRSAP